MWNYGFGWGFFPGGILWALFWIFLVYLLWGRGGRWYRWHGHEHEQKEKTAEDILNERFAKGEINEEEYEKRLSILKKHAK